MKIVIMRHGEAEHFAASDAERSLTAHGRTTSYSVAQRCVANGISQFDKVFVSPYLRAQQTWLEIAPLFHAKQVEECDDITPYGDSETVVEYIQAKIELENLKTVLLVSHLPLVGYLTADFVTGIMPPMFPTSGLVCIDYDTDARRGELVWNINP
ncbi:phosphohistidine phosphatase SixA [Vibrio renipiscarius]|uniref:Phosphohistidine phosphatase n=1 Tax=Vibrio renipiscarius TaxID=1461322 RepID=A0A0C2JKH9_9VIBR|nr:phosphohistidine phosphatase SixA [Vibrio renipiscarius]KII75481.1 phosphohistidine phosphatase [Vibrio renipiscarius]KII78469.1 phosphohistidine phosphatase [Vibrio renipiscarius]